MALPVGTALGPYVIAAPLGAGGMGEVYRARDSRLQRDVAIKVIAAELATDAERMRRFADEARAAAALNHPNILSVFDIGAATGDAGPYIVSELLDGETLAARLARGPLTPRTALEMSIQVARALASAHDKGIVHRDLKPDNLFVTREGTPKILDFGLAKLRETTDHDDATIVGRVRTSPGVVLGTVGYMAPEQVRGQTADHRADIFALGCVMYEMVVGQRVFTGPSAVDTLHAILHADPPELPPTTTVSSALERVIRRCLEKEPLQRFQSARDLAFALEAIGDSRTSAPVVLPPPSGARRRPLLLAAVSGLGLALAGLAGYALRPPGSPAPGPVIRFEVAVGDHVESTSQLSPRISPDGRYVVVRVAGREGPRLVLYDLTENTSRDLPGTEAATAPLWSPDGRSVVYRVGVELRRLDLQSSASTELTRLPAEQGPLNGSWGLHDDILLMVRDGIVQVSARGGEARRLILDLPSEHVPGYPVFLPDGRRFLFTTRADAGPSLYLGEVGQSGVQKIDGDVGGRITFAPPEGALLLDEASRLVARRLDLSARRLTGTPVEFAGDVAPPGFSASPHAIAFSTVRPAEVQFRWTTRNGLQGDAIGPPGQFVTFDLSDDGRQVVAARRLGEQSDLWTIDARSGALARLTASSETDTDPRWSHDGVLFGSGEAARRGAFRTSPSGAVPAFPFSGRNPAIDDWSRDGRWFVYHEPQGPGVLWAREHTPDAQPIEAYRAVIGIVDQAQMSPDSRLLAFNGNASGQFEVLVTPFPPTGKVWQVSSRGGVQPTWRADGQELYFLSLDGSMFAVTVRPGAPEPFGEPRRLFQSAIASPSFQVEQYAVAPDGQRFLFALPIGAATPASFTVVTNWMRLLSPPTP